MSSSTFSVHLRGLTLEDPAGKPPPGSKSNLEDPENLQSAALGVGITCLTLATLVVAIAMYTRVKILRRMVVEDWMLLLSWVFYAVAYNIPALRIAVLPGGLHQWDSTVKKFIELQHWYYFAALGFSLTMTPLKVSILLQILRVFVPRGARNVTFWATHALIWLNVVFYGIVTFGRIFSCKPIAKAWDVTIQGGHCLNRLDVNIAVAAINAVSDFLMLVLPQAVIWKLHMPTKKKIGVSAIFFFAFVACVFATVRLYYCVLLADSSDKSYFYAAMGMFTWPEMTSGFLVACLPNLPKFFQQPSFIRMAKKLKSSTSRSEQTQQQQRTPIEPPRASQKLVEPKRWEKDSMDVQLRLTEQDCLYTPPSALLPSTTNDSDSNERLELCESDLRHY